MAVRVEDRAERRLRAAGERAVRDAGTRRGLRFTRDACTHVPPRPGCPPCAEVALRLALDEIADLRVEFDR